MSFFVVMTTTLIISLGTLTLKLFVKFGAVMPTPLQLSERIVRYA